jgi:GNAT superfamily N-acetyltransferase
MALATWWNGDILPELPPLPNFHVAATDNISLLVHIIGVTQEEIQSRLNTRHRAYVAWLDDKPAAYGWVASHRGAVVEIGLRFELPEHDRYLWDFATLTQWRGRGIYPRLLQAIIRQESDTANRFWIMYAPHNDASASGIRKAGFSMVADFTFSSRGTIQLVPQDLSKRSHEATTLFKHFLL